MADLNTRLRGMLGFAMRAGKVLIGTDPVISAMQGKHKPQIVLISHTASDGTKKKLKFKCEFYGIKAVQINLSTEELGALLGKTYTPAVIGIMDEGFAKEIGIITSGQEI